MESAGAKPPVSARLFATTQWSVVLRAKDDSVTALNDLFTRYREPLIVFVRIKYDRNQAEEIVQGFCAHLLEQKFLANVALQKGKFRTFLLTSLEHYIFDLKDKANTLKRGEGKIPVSLDETYPDGQPRHSPMSPKVSPDIEYDRAWAHTIVCNALHQVEKEYADSGHPNLCQALEPALYKDETSPDYRVIADSFGMTEGAVKVAAYRIKNRLRELIRDELMQTVSNAAEFKEELTYLFNLLSQAHS
jgi:RNA polymerase sigma-70 factor (ECF subfamily)